VTKHSSRPFFEVVGSITAIANGREIRELARLKKVYGAGRWRKLKGTATVRLPDGSTVRAEVHWYERHGLGRREMKIKKLLGDDE
jgi:hypothetical protein